MMNRCERAPPQAKYHELQIKLRRNRTEPKRTEP